MRISISYQTRFLLSVAAGVAAAAAVWIFLKNEQRKISNYYTMTTALCAKKYIAGGKMVTPDLVEEVQVPVAYLPPSAVAARSELLDSGKAARYKARIGLVKGDVLTKTKLLEASTLLGLAWTLQPPQTALCLKFNTEDAVAGLVHPGDWVNVISLRNDQSRLLLPHVRVAAVNDQVWDPSTFPVQNEIPKTVASDSIFVTLVLTPHEALVASLAADKGKVVLALASPLETEPPVPEMVRLADLKKPGG